MKNFTKLRIALTMALMVAGMAPALAQLPVPAPVGTIYKHGTNAGGPVASEDPDRVTTGTQVLYLVAPDPDLNTGWATAVTAGSDARTTTGISSTASWTWTIPAAINPGFSSAANKGHFIMLDITGAASATPSSISVVESNGTSCTGNSKSINVLIVDQPTASAVSVPSPTTCGSGTNGSLGVALPVFTLTKSTDSDIPGDATVKVKATLTFTSLIPASFPNATIFTDKILSVAADGTISNSDIATAAGDPAFKLDKWGTYTLSITKISDKISRKDLDATRAGYFDVTASTTYSVLKPPTTGDIYHLPNN